MVTILIVILVLDDDMQSHERDCISSSRRKDMVTILIVILVLALVGVLPAWPYSKSWGFYPSGGVGLVLLVLIVLLIAGRI